MGQVTFTEYFHLLLTGREPTEEQRFFLDLARRARRARADADERGRPDDVGGSGRVAGGSGCSRDSRRGLGRARDVRCVRGALEQMQTVVATGREPPLLRTRRSRDTHNRRQVAWVRPSGAQAGQPRARGSWSSQTRAASAARTSRSRERSAKPSPTHGEAAHAQRLHGNLQSGHARPRFSFRIRPRGADPRSHCELAHLVEEEEHPLGFFMASKAEEAIEYRPPAE